MCAAALSGKLNREGMELCNQGKFDQSLTTLLKALEISKDLKSDVHQAKIQNNIGLVFKMQGYEEQANRFFTKALKKVEEKVGTEVSLYSRIKANLESAAVPAA